MLTALAACLVQYQELRKPQFGSSEPPGFVVEVNKVGAAPRALCLRCSPSPPSGCAPTALSHCLARLQRVTNDEGRPQLRLTRANAAQAAAWEAEQREARIAAIHDAAGVQLRPAGMQRARRLAACPLPCPTALPPRVQVSRL